MKGETSLRRDGERSGGNMAGGSVYGHEKSCYRPIFCASVQGGCQLAIAQGGFIQFAGREGKAGGGGSVSIAVERVVRGILGGLVAIAMTGLATPERAQAQSRVALVRDAETEALIQDYLKPIYKAAGLRSTSVELYLVNNPSFNAFVASGDKIFVNTGAIIDSKTPNELIGVLAHETGHLAGNHQIQLRQQLETAKTRRAPVAASPWGRAKWSGVGCLPISVRRRWRPTVWHSPISTSQASRRRA
jgi:hypothetical protein